jgi:hypothetical protein
VSQSADSPEIAEIPPSACNSLYGKEDDHGDDGSSPFCPEATETKNVLGANDNNPEIQALHGATAIAADCAPHVNDAEPSVPETSHERCDTTSLEAAEQRTNRTHSAFNTGCSDEFLNSLAEPLGRTSASTTASALSFPTLVDDERAVAGISNIIITKITDERIRSSGIQYKCELEPVWLPINLAKNAQMGPVCIRSYENGLILAQRLGTLRSRKRTLSQAC